MRLCTNNGVSGGNIALEQTELYTSTDELESLNALGHVQYDSLSA